MKMLNKSKKSQEEMVGFALIIIIVSVIMLIFLAISLSNNQKENVESYEVESFIQGFLQHTTDCRDNLEFLEVQKLIFKCVKNELCSDGRKTCEVLSEVLNELVSESWIVEEDTPVKGYNLLIAEENSTVVEFSDGNITSNSKGSIQDFSRSGRLISISFEAYY